MADFLSEVELNDLDWLLNTSEFEELPNVGQPSPPAALPNNQNESRFKVVNQNEVEDFISAQENENTKRKTRHDTALFFQFCKEQGEERQIENLDVKTLDMLIGNFIATIKKPNGNEYEPSTVRGFLSSIDRYLRSKHYPHTALKNPMFSHTNAALKAKCTYLKSQGYGSKPREADELTDNDIDNLFKSGQLGQTNAFQLLNLLHITFSLVMGMRGGREQKELKWGDIELRTDEDGDEYIEHTRERQTKTRTGVDPGNTRKFKPKAWANTENPERCPVRAYKLYREKRPASMKNPTDPFFLSINYVKNPKPDTAWFKPVPMGLNQIYKLVKTMRLNCDSISNDRQITNHSVRKHLMQKCNDMGLPATSTIQFSGHKNVGSANNYSHLNQAQQKAISNQLTRTSSSQSIVPLAQQTENQPAIPSSSVYNRPEQNFTYSQQHSHQQSMMRSIFHGSTVINGGTFNFYPAPTADTSHQTSSPNYRKLKRIRMIESSESESDN